jgi:Ca2+-binding RTX toxin-like protein
MLISRGGFGLAMLCAGAIGVLGSGGTAAAGTATMSSVTTPDQAGDDVVVGALHYAAAPGEANDLSVVSRSSGRALFVDDPAGVTPGPGCRAVTAVRVGCAVPGARLLTADVELGDGDDRVTGLGPVSRFTVDGGSGDDTLGPTVAAGWFSTASGGPGADTLVSGSSTVHLDGGPGPDRFSAMAGVEGIVTYAGRTAPVDVTVGAGAGDDGEAGEGDTVDATITTVIGGAGADRLVAAPDGPPRGFAAPGSLPELDGASGDDLLAAGSIGVRLEGGAGHDRLLGSPSNDLLDGAGVGIDEPDASAASAAAQAEAAGDTVVGGTGSDLITGGPGPDEIDAGPGGDHVAGGGGADAIRARDGAADLVTCGGPSSGSVATLDPRDSVRSCSTVRRSGPAMAHILQFGPDNAWDRYLAEIACPQDAVGGCAVTLRLVSGRSAVGRRATQLAPGGTRFVSVIVRRAARRALRRHPCAPRVSLVLDDGSRSAGRTGCEWDGFGIDDTQSAWDALRLPVAAQYRASVRQTYTSSGSVKYAYRQVAPPPRSTVTGSDFSSMPRCVSSRAATSRLRTPMPKSNGPRWPQAPRLSPSSAGICWTGSMPAPKVFVSSVIFMRGATPVGNHGSIGSKTPSESKSMPVKPRSR